jgi:hypothetical protein
LICRETGIPARGFRSIALVGPPENALTSPLDDGSVDALARQWLTFDPAKARVLR